MNTEVTPFSKASTELTTEAFATALAFARSAMKTSQTNPFLKLTKQGVWLFGQDDVPVQEGSLWALNPHSLQHGYIAWGDAEVLGEEMVGITQPRPVVSALPAHTYDVKVKGKIETKEASWDEQISVLMRCMAGEDEGTQVLYKTTSRGGLNAMGKYIDALMRQMDIDAAAMVAVVTLGHDSYNHKTYGAISVPILEIQEFVTLNG